MTSRDAEREAATPTQQPHTLRGVSTVSLLAEQAGVSCSTAETELLLLPSPRVRFTPLTSIQVMLDEQPITRVFQLRLVGMRLQANTSITAAIHLRTHTPQSIGVINCTRLGEVASPP